MRISGPYYCNIHSRPISGRPEQTYQQVILKLVLCIFCYFVQWPKKSQLIEKLSHSYMFRHYRIILREFVVSTLPSYTSMSNAVIGNTI